MPKHALSVTLDQDNLLWLRARTTAGGAKSLSETLDRLITAARQSGEVGDETIRSVVGTIDINEDDPELVTADTYVRSLFDRSARQPWLVRERRPAAGSARAARQRRPKRG